MTVSLKHFFVTFYFRYFPKIKAKPLVFDNQTSQVNSQQ